MGIWSELSSMMATGADAVEGLFGMGDTAGQATTVAHSDPGLSAGLSAEEIGGLDADAAQPGAAEQALSAEDADSWVGDALKPAMQGILGAAMRPHAQAHAAPATPGHGINASGGSAMEPFKQVLSMADDNPLANLHQWSNLF